MAHIHSMNSGGAPLEKAVSESSGRRSNIEADPAVNWDLPAIQGAFELQPPSPYVLFALFDFHFGIFFQLTPRLIGFLAVDKDLTSHDGPLGLLPRRKKPSLNEQLIEA